MSAVEWSLYSLGLALYTATAAVLLAVA